MTGRVFEYLATRKPILAVAPRAANWSGSSWKPGLDGVPTPKSLNRSRLAGEYSRLIEEQP